MLLLQKRAACKESWASMWDISSAGHVSAGDGSVDTALREVEEELGLRIPRAALELLFVYKQQSSDPTASRVFINNEFNDVFLVTIPDAVPLSAFSLQEEEVDAVAWFPVEEVEEAWRTHREGFVPQNTDEDDYGQIFRIIRERYRPARQRLFDDNDNERCEVLEQCCGNGNGIDAPYAGHRKDQIDTDVPDEMAETLRTLHGHLDGRKSSCRLASALHRAFAANGGPWRDRGAGMAFMSTADAPASLTITAPRTEGVPSFPCRIAFPQRKWRCSAFGPILDCRICDDDE